MLFLRQDEIWSLCQWQLKVHCQHNRSSRVIGDSSKFLSSYKANKIKSRVMWLWGKSRPCAVHTSAFSRVWLNHHGNNHSSLEPAVRWPLMLCSLSSALCTLGLQKVCRGQWATPSFCGTTHLFCWNLSSSSLCVLLVCDTSFCCCCYLIY